MIVGCECGARPTPETAHYQGWDALVVAAALGELSAVRAAARDVAPADLVRGPEVERIGGALGMAQVAEPDEIADVVAAIAVACGDCHARGGVSPRGGAPPTTHERAASAAAYAVVFRGEPWPLLPEAARVDQALSPRERLAGVLATCADCHRSGERDRANSVHAWD